MQHQLLAKDKYIAKLEFDIKLIRGSCDLDLAAKNHELSQSLTSLNNDYNSLQSNYNSLKHEFSATSLHLQHLNTQYHSVC